MPLTKRSKKEQDELQASIKRINDFARELGFPPYEEDEDEGGMTAIIGFKRPTKKPPKGDGQPRDPESKGTASLTKSYDERVDEALKKATEELRAAGIPPLSEEDRKLCDGLGVIIGFKRPTKKGPKDD